MAKHTIAFKTKGMNRDTSVSAFNPEFSFENMNLRLSTVEGNTTLSWVNERGPKKLDCSVDVLSTDGSTSATTKSLEGTPVGMAVLNHQLVLFTTASGQYPDRIYVLKYEDGSITGKRIFCGNLNFSVLHPLETLVSYESEQVQKVYWTDNYNQPRVINIAKGFFNTSSSILYTGFDFAPEISNLDDTEVYVKKIIGGGGSFSAGVIQYAFTYYNKYGQETAIFHVTPLLYISYADRGVAPDDIVDNVFKITVKYLDISFDYLRIYSIQRTSLNDTPIVKRVQDISLENGKNNNYSITYTDTGTNGDTVDPTELLYKGSENIIAKTLEQKDGTLFLGNLTNKNLSISDDITGKIKVGPNGSSIGITSRKITSNRAPNVGYAYYNQLNAVDSKGYNVPCGGFKTGDYYRLGVQFQYKTGKWSRPIWVGDQQMTIRPSEDAGTVLLPIFQVTFQEDVISSLISLGYRRARPLVVFPKPQDRMIICQGVASPTVYTDQQAATDKSLSAQSSWFFRTLRSDESNGPAPMNISNGAVVPLNSGYLALHYATSGSDPEGQFEQNYNPNYNAFKSGFSDIHSNIRQMELEGLYDNDHAFKVNTHVFTVHTPELEFDEFKAGLDFTGTEYQCVGWQSFAETYSDIDIQTSSPTISSEGSGFIHKSFHCSGAATEDDDPGNYGIVSGLFYNDFVVDDKTDSSIMKYDKEYTSVNWMVYLWQATGSLNNDINRSSDLGTATAALQKKIISNLRYAQMNGWNEEIKSEQPGSIPQLFDSDEVTILKLDDDIYMGNVDTLVVPTEASGKYFTTPAGITTVVKKAWKNNQNKFTGDILWKTLAFDTEDEENKKSNNGLYHFSSIWTKDSTSGSHIGDYFVGLVRKKNSVRMKYKSTPHLVLTHAVLTAENNKLPVLEFVRNISTSNLFGGTSEDALRENTWVPCGDSARLEGGNNYTINYSYGDTYYQRWDCLKTYPFTTDDINQVVEIGSFMLETHYNVAGRYDRNRGQASNLHMSPRNFNLFNPIYSQKDNFFSYKILDDDSYKNNAYYNQVTWTLTKNSNSDVDAWTHITLINTLELDGDKGGLNKLTRFNDQLLAFQDTGISQILYNENTQISTTEGVPIEIGNSGKVQGKRYISDTIGCSNKWSLVNTPSGIYFMDNYDRSIYFFNGQLQNLSLVQGFDSWCKQHITNASDSEWTPINFQDFVSYYDKVNQDVLFISKDTALAYSEKVGTFTSFYNYQGIPYLVNLDNTALWIKDSGDITSEIWEHNKGAYCNFFGKQYDYSITLIGNVEPQNSKIFTNLELRASVDGDGTETANTFTPITPFDGLEVWNEYQHGYTAFGTLTGAQALQHSTAFSNMMKRRFRIWRCDVPRDNVVLDKNRAAGTSYPYSKDATLNITRTKVRPLDRMRNPWVYLKLKKSNGNCRTEIHDVVVTYYN